MKKTITIYSVLVLLMLLSPLSAYADEYLKTENTYLYDSAYQVVKCDIPENSAVRIIDSDGKEYNVKANKKSEIKVKRKNYDREILISARTGFFDYDVSRPVKIRKAREPEHPLFDYIEKSIMSDKTTINVDGYNMTEIDYRKLTKHITNKKPSLFFESSFRRFPGSDYIQFIDIVEDDFLDKTKKLDSELEGLKFYGTDREKVTAVHDYVINKTEYSEELNEDSFYAYGAFFNGEAVCQGYSALFKAICDVNDIKCKVVFNDEEDHVYNKVNIDDEWLIVDTTWDDSGDDHYKYCLSFPDKIHK